MEDSMYKKGFQQTDNIDKIVKRNFWSDLLENFYFVYQKFLIIGVILFLFCIVSLVIQGKKMPSGLQKSNSMSVTSLFGKKSHNSANDSLQSGVENDSQLAETQVPQKTLIPVPAYNDAEENIDEDSQDTYDDNEEEYEYTEDSEEFIFSDSDIRKLTRSDIQHKTKKELRIARNEIYARHGRRFRDSELQQYFDSKDWYDGTIEPEDFDDATYLSELERRNAKYIQKFE